MTMVVSTSDVWMKSDAYHRVRISQSLQGFLSPLPLFTYLQPTTMLLQGTLEFQEAPKKPKLLQLANTTTRIEIV
jgi:hypothetical protein